jgi:RHS repeat-associated protein
MVGGGFRVRRGAGLSRARALVARSAVAATATLVAAGTLGFVAASPASAIGSNAIVSGFNSNNFGPNDDGSYPCTGSGAGTPSGCTPTAISLPFSPDFFGATYSSLYLNNNGNLTFGQALATYTPYPLSSLGPPIIAPFFADVDTRTGNTVTFGTGNVDGHNAFGVNWPGVGCYSENTSVLNYFQVLLVDRSDISAGDFDIEFNYDQIQWDSGEASGGNSSCQGGTAARAGYASGQGATGSYYEIPGSGSDGAFLDSISVTGLVHNSFNSSQLGRYIYQFRNGQPVTTSGAPQSGTGIAATLTSVHSPTCDYSVLPVNCASGDFWHTFTDVSVAGRGPSLALTRTYNSLNASSKGIFGLGWSSSYDMHLTTNADGSVTVTAEDGSAVTATNNGGGSYLIPSWADSTLTQNANGTWTFVRHQTETFSFSSAGLLTSITDRNGYATTLAYNSSSQLTTVTDAAGRTIGFSYGSNGLVSRVTDPAGQVTQYGYDASEDLTSVTDPAGRVTSLSYDANHLLLTMTDPRGGVTTNVYDTSGRVTKQTDPAGLVTSFAYSGANYSATGGTTTITDPHGNVETQQYVNGELMSLTKGSGSQNASTWSYAYDPATLGQTSVTDPDGHTASATFDSNGNLLTSTDALGNTTTYTYNAFDEPLTVTDPMGIETSYGYDSTGNLLTKTVTGTGGSPVETTTDAVCEASCPSGYQLGDLESVIDPDGHVTNDGYDAYGDVAATITHPSANTTDTTAAVYDVLGRKVCEASANATAAGVACPPAGGSAVADTSRWAFNADGEVTSATNSAGQTTSYSYDADGNQVQVTDPLGNVTTTSYDLDGRKTAATQGSGTSAAATTSYGYDVAYGSGACTATVAGATYCTTSTGPTGALTVDYFDAQDRQLVQVLDAGTAQAQTTTSSYDGAGNALSQQTPGGLATFAYDADNRLTSVTYSQPAGGYSAASNVSYVYNADGVRTQMTDGTGTTSYSYDPLGRLSSTTNGAGATTSYGYDADNNVTSLTYPNGQSVARTYDGAGEWSSVTDWQHHTTSFSYDHDGNMTTEGLGNGIQAASVFDATDAMSSTTVTRGSSTVDQQTYTRNANSQVLNDAQCGSNTACYSEAYGYDPLGRVSTLQEPEISGPSYPYAYDAAGDLTGIPANTTQSYNAGNEVTSLSEGIAQVGQIETATSAASQSSLGVSLPAGIQPFDQILVAVFEVNSQSAATPSGYVSVGTFGASTSGSERVQLFRRTATGGESSVTVSFGLGATLGASIMASVYRGVDASDPVEQLSSGSAVLPSNNTISVPPVTTELPNELLLLYQGANTENSGNFSTPGMYEAAQVATSNSFTGTGGLAEELQASAGATGTKTVTFTSSEAVASMAGVLLSVRPSVSTFSYDTAGDRTSQTTPGRPSQTLGYDQAGRLVSYTSGAGTYHYLYNGDGLRMEKLPPSGPAEAYSWDVSGGTPELLTDGSMNYIYGPGGLVLEQIQSPAIAYVNGTTYLDGLGSASSQTVSLPSGTAVGDQVIVGVTEANNESSSISTAGYSSLGTFTQSNADRLDVYNHTVAPGDSSFTVSWQTNGSAHPKEVVVAVYSGVDPNTPVDAVTGAANSSATTSQSLGPLTTSQAGEELVMVQSASGNTSGVTWSASGMTERGASSASQTLSASAVADQGLGATGPTGSRTSSISGSLTTPQLAGALVALFPVQAYFYVHDQRGTTRMITDSAGDVLASYFYGPYGQNPVAMGSAGVLANNPFTYEGQYQDPESGYVYLRARYYDPGTGQFLSVDPAVNATGQSYAYSFDDPVNGSDPSGLWGIQTPLGCIGNCGPPNRTKAYRGAGVIPPYFAPVTLMNTNSSENVTVYGGGGGLDVYVQDTSVSGPFFAGQESFTVCVIGVANQCQTQTEYVGGVLRVFIPASDGFWAIQNYGCRNSVLTSVYQFSIQASLLNQGGSPDFSVFVGSKNPVYDITGT